MKLIYIQSSDHDAARVAGTYFDVKKKFFQHHQFLILPYPKHKYVYLPELDYSSLLNVKIEPTYHPGEYKTDELKAIQTQMDTLRLPKTISADEIKKEFNKVKAKLEAKNKIVFSTSWSIEDVYIIVTPFGTDGSFDYKKVGSKYRIYVWIRNSGCNLEQVISHVIHCYISAYVLIATNISDSLTDQWKQREAIVDFLIKYPYRDLDKKYTSSTLPFIQSKQRTQQLVEESDRYLTRLNAKMKVPTIKRIDTKYFIDNKITDSISEKERALLELLFNHKNTFVSKDTILSTVYNEFEGSDWSVSKLIERLRKKIYDSGVVYPIIKTSRNMGYKLICR